MMINQTSSRESPIYNKGEDTNQFEDDNRVQPIFEDLIENDYSKGIKAKKISNKDNIIHEEFGNADEESKSIASYSNKKH